MGNQERIIERQLPEIPNPRRRNKLFRPNRKQLTDHIAGKLVHEGIQPGVAEVLADTVVSEFQRGAISESNLEEFIHPQPKIITA